MKNNINRFNLIVCAAALTLGTVSILRSQIQAHPNAINNCAAQSNHIDLYKNVWVEQGLARGQTLRYTWANLSDPDSQKREFEPLRIRGRLLADDGSLVAQAEAAAVGAGQFQSFDFNRDQINLPGEANGRLQVRLEVTVSGQVKYPNLVLKQGILESFEDTVEVIDNFSGRTTVILGGGKNEMILNDSQGNEYLNPNAFQIISTGKDYLIGFVSGQTLRISALNPFAQPSPGEDGRKFKMLFAVTVLLADGRVVAQTDEITLDPGDSHSFYFKRSDLPLPLSIEPGGRVQARVRVIFTKFQLKTEFPSSIEIIDDSTGKTTVQLSQKPKEIVVVGSKIKEK